MGRIAAPMTMEELLALPVSFHLKLAARALGIGENKAYRMARGEDADPFPCPVQKYGPDYRVTRPDLFRVLGLDPATIAVPAPRPAQAGPPPAGGDGWDAFDGPIEEAAQ